MIAWTQHALERFNERFPTLSSQEELTRLVDIGGQRDGSTAFLSHNNVVLIVNNQSKTILTVMPYDMYLSNMTQKVGARYPVITDCPLLSTKREKAFLSQLKEDKKASSKQRKHLENLAKLEVEAKQNGVFRDMARADLLLDTKPGVEGSPELNKRITELKAEGRSKAQIERYRSYYMRMYYGDIQ